MQLKTKHDNFLGEPWYKRGLFIHIRTDQQ